MPIVKYTPFADTEDFPAGLRLFQDTINRLFSDQTTAGPGLQQSISWRQRTS